MTRLYAEDLTLGYEKQIIVDGLSLQIPDGQITTIIGPNGCGKSTLLRSLARLLSPRGGAAVLDGQAIHTWPTREVAKRLGLLGQQPPSMGGMAVEDLVRRGRHPHLQFLQSPGGEDEAAVHRALAWTRMVGLRERAVDSLSGGQRQRAWIAMALAQDTGILLLDEPTTYLDLAHQLEVTDLIQRLNANLGRTILMVLHDVNEAARASHRIVAMKDGAVLRAGPPDEVVEPTLLAELYGTPCDVYPDPVSGRPMCVPRGQARLTRRSPRAPLNGGTAGAPSAVLTIRDLRVGYDGKIVIDGLSLDLPRGAVTAIVGPNACGKSTLFRACGRLLDLTSGTIELNGANIHRDGRKHLAKRLAMLMQETTPPHGFTVEDLVARGRTPHRTVFKQWRATDESAVENALVQCSMCELRTRALDAISGGQQQRARIGMALAQETPTLMLDEPTTFLDLGAQIALLDLVRRLNRNSGDSVVMILHDLNLAARYADYLVVMKDGAVVARGEPADVVTEAMLRDVFRVEATVGVDPLTGGPLIWPHRALPDGELDQDGTPDLIAVHASMVNTNLIASKPAPGMHFGV